MKAKMGRRISLLIRSHESRQYNYPTDRIQKGLIIVCENHDLAEEGAGFGVPLLKFGYETIFPGDVTAIMKRGHDSFTVTADYRLNLVQRNSVKGKNIDSKGYYKIQEYLSMLYRKYPSLRGVFARASKGLRLVCGIETRFDDTADVGIANVVYTIRTKQSKVNVNVSANLRESKMDGCTQVIMLNEQGANHFDQYRDSGGLILTGNAIGAWDETSADWASIVDRDNGIEFSLQKIEGAKMFRGREIMANRLAWSGLNYVIPPTMVDFNYNISIGAIA